MKIAVTGASGFIGRRVVAQLLRAGHSVTAMTRRADADLPAEVVTVEGSLEDPGDGLYRRLGRPDCCVHLAWGTLDDFTSMDHVEHELPRQFAFLKGLIAGGLPSLVVAGTCLEYGMRSGCLDEEMATDPTTPYGLAKDGLRRQLALLRARTPFSFAWARLFYMHGDAPRRRTLLTQLRGAVERGDARFAMSAGEQLRDYLSVDDVADRLVRLSGADDPGIVNICSGQPISVRRLVEGWIEANGWTIALDLGRYPYPEYEPLAFWGSDVKLRRILAGGETVLPAS